MAERMNERSEATRSPRAIGDVSAADSEGRSMARFSADTLLMSMTLSCKVPLAGRHLTDRIRGQPHWLAEF